MTFPTSNLMKQTIAATSLLRPRPVKNVVTGNGDYRGPGLHSKEGHGANRFGLGEKENVANWRIGNAGGDRMQEDVFFPLPTQHRQDSENAQPSTANMRRKFARENPRAVYMAVNDKDPRSQLLNAGFNAIEDSSFGGTRLVPYSIMQAGRGDARGQNGKSKQPEVVSRTGRDTVTQDWASQQAGPWGHSVGENAFETRPTAFKASIHPSRSTPFANQNNPLENFALHRPELAHDSSSFPNRHPHPRHADPSSNSVDKVPLSTPTSSHESRWRRDSLDNDVVMSDLRLQANVHPGQGHDVEMGERTPLVSTQAIVHMVDAPINDLCELLDTSFGTGYTFIQPPAPPVVSNIPPHFPFQILSPPSSVSNFPPSRPGCQRRKTHRCRGPPPYPVDPRVRTRIRIRRDRTSNSGPAGARPQFRRSEGFMPLGVDATIPQPSSQPFAQTTPTYSSIYPNPASSLPNFPPSAITMAPHFADPLSSTPAYPPVMNPHETPFIKSLPTGQGFVTPSPSPPSQRRQRHRCRGPPPYPVDPGVRTRIRIRRDRTSNLGPAGARPQFGRSEGFMPLGVDITIPQPFAQAIYPTPPSSIPNFPPSAIMMAPHYAGSFSSSPAYPPVMNPHETPFAKSLSDGQGFITPSPSPPSQRRKTRRHRGTPPYPDTGIHRDRTLKSGPAGAHPQLNRAQGLMPLGVGVIIPQPSPPPFALATPVSSSTPSSSRRRKIHRCRGTPPYTPTPSRRTKTGTCQDRAFIRLGL